MVPETQSETGRISCHSGSFFALLTPPPPTPPHPPNDPENQNFEKKNEKMPGDIFLMYIHVHHK